MLRIEHISQPAVLVEDLDEAMDWLHRVFGIFPSERVDIARSGVNNAVYAFGNRTYLELIEPYDPEGSAYRLLKQNGPGWHMVNVDIADDDFEVLDAEIRATGARVVQLNRTEHVAAAWHLHPRDTHGVLLNLANPTDHDEHGMWAGWAWREYVSTNTRVVDRILGLSLATEGGMHLQDQEEGDQHPFSLTLTKNIPSSCIVREGGCGLSCVIREGGCGLGCFLNVYFLPLGLT